MLRQILRLCAVTALVATLAVDAWAEKTWMVNYKDVDIHEVIKTLADVTEKTVVIDPRVKGKVKVMSKKPLNKDEVVQLFRTVFEIHDFSLVEVNDVIRIIPLKDTRSSPVPVAEPRDNARGFITQVIQLQNIAAAKVLPSIRPLVPQHSHLSAYDPANAIIITDSAENIARIRALIEKLDTSATPVTEIIELRYANAADLVQVLDNLEKDEKRKSSPQNAVNLTADKRNNAILITGEDLQRERLKSLIVRLDKPRAQTGNVRVIYLEYADAKTVAETLTKVMANLQKVTPGGEKGAQPASATVEADEDTNALLITASGDELQTLLDVVARLDIRRAQVLVEAIIAEVRDQDTKNLGIEWMYRNTENGVFGTSQTGGNIGSVATGAAAGLDDPDSAEAIGAFAQGIAGVTGQLLGIVGGGEKETFLGVLNALESNSKNNILSTPSILTMDNHEASFTVGDNIPIKTGSTTTQGTLTPFQTFQREDVGIKLTVTPQVNEGDTVLLDIQQEVSNVNREESSSDGIITSKRRIETQVLTSSGEIIVLGGLIEERQGKGENHVPILSKIPLLGALFRSKSNSGLKSNLMVFLRATVIRSDAQLAGATSEKYTKLRDQQLQMRENGFLRMDSKNMPVLPEYKHYAPEHAAELKAQESTEEPAEATSEQE